MTDSARQLTGRRILISSLSVDDMYSQSRTSEEERRKKIDYVIKGSRGRRRKRRAYGDAPIPLRGSRSLRSDTARFGRLACSLSQSGMGHYRWGRPSGWDDPTRQI